MSEPTPHTRASWAAMRREFDASFAVATDADPAPREQFLLVAVAGMPCAVPLGECGGVVPAPVVTPLPAREPGFVGVAAFAGAVLPVYDLAARIDPAMPVEPRRKWVLLTAGAERVALLVDAVEGRVSRERSSDAGATVVTLDGNPRRFVSPAALVGLLRDSLRRSGANGR